jgi:hypothetical protein
MADNILYLEVDEEITAAIDRLIKSPGAAVKIVVPKRSTLLQSIVNLKLLKRAADDAGKELVLVTSDQTSTHLAGRVGLAVASTLKSSASIPERSQPEPDAAEVLEAEDDGADDEPAPEAAVATAGAVAKGQNPTKPAYAKPMMVRTPVSPHEEGTGKSGPRIPNFDSLQKRLLLVVAGVGVIILFFVINYFIKSATVTLFAKGDSLAANVPFTVDPAAKSSDPATSVLAGTNQASSHDLTTTTPATGTKDIGTKAGGTITVTNYCYNPGTLPAGTVFAASGGQKFTSTADVAIPAGVPFLGSCGSTTAAVPVVATANGDSYNLASGTIYSVGSAPSDKLKGTGGQMSGGTSKTVNIVTQADIDKAKQTLLDGDKDAAHKDLDNKVTGNNRAIEESFTQTASAVTATPAVGEEGSQTAIKLTVSYSLLSVSKTDFEAMLKAAEQKQVSAQKQVYDDGAGNAQLTAVKVTPAAASTFTLATNFTAGVKIDTAAVAKQITGKKYGDAADIAAKTPGVDKAEISTWPFWVTTTPRITDHIKVSVKATGN